MLAFVGPLNVERKDRNGVFVNNKTGKVVEWGAGDFLCRSSDDSVCFVVPASHKDLLEQEVEIPEDVETIDESEDKPSEADYVAPRPRYASDYEDQDEELGAS